MSNRQSAFTKSLLPAAKMMAAGAGVTAVGIPVAYAGFSGGEGLLMVLGVCAVLAGPAMLIMPLFMERGGYGDCPICATKIEALAGGAQNLLCRGCGAYLDVDGERLVTIERARTNPTPFFAVPTPWPDVRNVLSSTIAFSASDYVGDVIKDAMMKNEGPHVMEARWPPGCSVCGAPEVRRDQFSLDIKMAGNIRDKRAKLVVRDIPYCGAHKDGIDFADIYFASPGSDRAYVMRFRSHAYREAFRALNPWRWEGMVAAAPSPAVPDPAPAPSTSPEPERVVIGCPKCGQQLRVPTGRTGTVTCPTCAGEFAVST